MRRKTGGDNLPGGFHVQCKQQEPFRLFVQRCEEITENRGFGGFPGFCFGWHERGKLRGEEAT